MTVVDRGAPAPLADATCISAPLLTNPPTGVVAPVVTGVGDRSQCRLEQLPAAVVVERLLDRPGDVRTTPASADAVVELAREVVVEGYVTRMATQ